MRRLLSHGVAVKERDDAIGFVTPDDVFLQMGERAVTDVLNGIAYDEARDRILVTGKNWNKIFEIEIFE